MNISIVERKEAKEKGLARYFTAKPCINGHIDERQTSNGSCIACSREWKKNNKEKVVEGNRAWLNRNPDYRRNHYIENKDRYEEYAKNNKEAIRKRMAEWRSKNKSRLSVYDKEYYSKNSENKKEYSRKWRSENPERVREQRIEFFRRNRGYSAEYARARRKSDPVYATMCRVRARVSAAFLNNGFNRNTKTEEIIGCTWLELKEHIERQFVRGMSWNNRGDWHIDHIVPLASAKTEEGIISLCHFTNLRPVWAGENLRKGAKMELLI